MTAYAPLRAERLRVTVLAAALDDEVPMAFGSLRDRRVCLVEVEAGGLVGVGESWINYPAWAAHERLATLCDGIAPLLLGRDVSDPPRVQRALAGTLLPVGRQWGAIGPIWQAISGVDLALWDLRGKLAGRSVAALLSTDGVRSGIPAYGSGVGPTDIARLSEVAVRQGLRAVKTKLGFGADRDQTTLSTARSVVGPDRQLFADANQAWSLDQARTMCPMLARYDVGWVEEPLEGDDLADLEKLSLETSVALATGENLYGTDTFDRYVDSPAVHTIQPDLAKSGGLTLGVQVAARAQHAGTAVAPHCYSGPIGLAASLHLAAAYGSVQWIELDVRDNPLRTELLRSPLRLEHGELVVPSGDGLGVQLDPAAVRRHQTHVEERTHHDL